MESFSGQAAAEAQCKRWGVGQESTNIINLYLSNLVILKTSYPGEIDGLLLSWILILYLFIVYLFIIYWLVCAFLNFLKYDYPI